VRQEISGYSSRAWDKKLVDSSLAVWYWVEQNV